MATITPKVLADAALTGSLADQYTVPAGTRTVIKQIAVTNNTGGVVNLTVALNPRSGGTDRTIVDDMPLADTQTFTAPQAINAVLEAGGKIRASGLNLVLYASGIEVV